MASDNYSIPASQVRLLTIGLISAHNMKNLHQLFQNKFIPSTIRILMESRETVCKVHMDYTMSVPEEQRKANVEKRTPLPEQIVYPYFPTNSDSLSTFYSPLL